MKNLLITGGYGFIGSNFINNFLDKYDDYFIVNIDALYYCASVDNVDNHVKSSNRYKEIIGNIQNKDIITHILKEYNIEYVIHFAAQSHVQNSFEESLQYNHDNILGTHTLLECCRIWGKIKKFIHVSTDEVYGESKINLETKMEEEKSILCPTNPYAATKAGAELIAQSYYHSFKMPIIITRGNNVYGKNQYPEKLIPKFINLLKKNEKVTIQGDGSCVRSFLHVNDVVNAFDIIFNKGIIGEIYNIGGDEDDEYSVSQISKLLIKKIQNTNNFNEWTTYIPDRPFNDQRYYICNKKLKNLGWKPLYNLERGLNELI